MYYFGAGRGGTNSNMPNVKTNKLAPTTGNVKNKNKISI